MQVRLITGADDPYAWKVLPEKEHLFKKHLSKHSIGAYVELWREVRVPFEAMLAGPCRSLPQYGRARLRLERLKNFSSPGNTP